MGQTEELVADGDLFSRRARRIVVDHYSSVLAQRVATQCTFDCGKESLGLRPVKVQGRSIRTDLISIVLAALRSCDRVDKPVLQCAQVMVSVDFFRQAGSGQVHDHRLIFSLPGTRYCAW